MSANSMLRSHPLLWPLSLAYDVGCSLVSDGAAGRLCSEPAWNRKISGYIGGITRWPGAGPMAIKFQRKATRAHRRRATARGLVRVEVQAPKKDAGLIRALAETLRGRAEKAEALRSTLANALLHPDVKTAFDIFGSELPDEAFTGVFDQPPR